MSQRITADFEIVSWDAKTYAVPDDGPRLSRATVTKRFSGAVSGVSTAELLVVEGDEGPLGYMATERVDGELEGRPGTFVIQHGGTQGGGDNRSFGYVVAGSGSGELSGLTGDCEFFHEGEEARFTLGYELP